MRSFGITTHTVVQVHTETDWHITGRQSCVHMTADPVDSHAVCSRSSCCAGRRREWFPSSFVWTVTAQHAPADDGQHRRSPAHVQSLAKLIPVSTRVNIRPDHWTTAQVTWPFRAVPVCHMTSPWFRLVQDTIQLMNNNMHYNQVTSLDGLLLSY